MWNRCIFFHMIKEHIQQDRTQVHGKQPKKAALSASIHRSLKLKHIYCNTSQTHKRQNLAFLTRALREYVPNCVGLFIRPQSPPSSSSWRTPGRWCFHHPEKNTCSLSPIINIFEDSPSCKRMLTWMKPLPTMESLQMLQKKHSLCQASVSKATNFVLPKPPLPIRKESKRFGCFGLIQVFNIICFIFIVIKTLTCKLQTDILLYQQFIFKLKMSNLFSNIKN